MNCNNLPQGQGQVELHHLGKVVTLYITVLSRQFAQPGMHGTRLITCLRPGVRMRVPLCLCAILFVCNLNVDI